MPSGYYRPQPQMVAANAAIVAHAANAVLVAADFGKHHTNTGAAAGITLTLPAASAVAGLAVRAVVLVAQTIQLIPATGGAIYLNGSGVADKYAQIAGVIGNYIEVYSDGVVYHATVVNGVATKQA